MQITVYTTADENVPAGHRCIARIMHNDGTWHPVLITALNEANARQKATEWWQAELAKAAAKKAPKRPKAAQNPEVGIPTAPVDDDFDVV